MSTHFKQVIAGVMPINPPELGGKPVEILLVIMRYFFPERPMKSGRPPAWNPVAALATNLWTEVVSLSSKSRLLLPAAARTRLNWIQGGQPLSLLVRIEPGSYAELEPWELAGDAIMERLASVLDDAPTEDRERIAIVAMDRYLRLTLESDGRMSLPMNLCHHLDAVPLDVVRLLVTGGRLQLWSERVWQDQRGERIQSVLEEIRLVEGTTGPLPGTG